ncbi:MAG: hypothetical protein ACE5E7_00085 [Anaerolineae bacterium]
MLKSTSRKLSLVLVVVLVFMVTAVAYAITITIDGVRETAWNGGGSVTDNNEAGVTDDGVDVQTIEWTNDTTNFYLLLNTYAATGWNTNNGPDFPYIYFCLNTDNNVGTGTASICIQGAGGYDRYVRVSGPTPLTVTVFDQNFNTIAATTSVATSANITEVSVDLTSLGFSAGNCGSVPSSAYFDGRTPDPDDKVQDGSDFTMKCGNPTAITLQNVDVSSQSTMFPVAVGILLLALISGGLIYNRKQQTA